MNLVIPSSRDNEFINSFVPSGAVEEVVWATQDLGNGATPIRLDSCILLRIYEKLQETMIFELYLTAYTAGSSEDDLDRSLWSR